MDNPIENVAFNLAVVMAEKKISQSELARRVKVDRSFITMVLNKTRFPSLRTLTKICNSLHITMNDLLKPPTSKKPEPA